MAQFEYENPSVFSFLVIPLNSLSLKYSKCNRPFLYIVSKVDRHFKTEAHKGALELEFMSGAINGNGSGSRKRKAVTIDSAHDAYKKLMQIGWNLACHSSMPFSFSCTH